MIYPASLKSNVHIFGHPPDSFLADLIAWGHAAPDEIFQPNDRPDIYGSVRALLGPWQGIVHRKGAMLEVLRCLAGFESSWNWKEGVDRTNRTSMTHREGQETGIFQVSFDSLELGGGALKPFAKKHGIDRVEDFIPAMKFDQPLALEYCARLLRVSIDWDGPIKRRELHPWLRRDAVNEFSARLIAVV